jgi:hypothetical protein
MHCFLFRICHLLGCVHCYLHGVSHSRHPLTTPTQGQDNAFYRVDKISLPKATSKCHDATAWGRYEGTAWKFQIVVAPTTGCKTPSNLTATTPNLVDAIKQVIDYIEQPQQYKLGTKGADTKGTKETDAKETKETDAKGIKEANGTETKEADAKETKEEHKISSLVALDFCSVHGHLCGQHCTGAQTLEICQWCNIHHEHYCLRHCWTCARFPCVCAKE